MTPQILDLGDFQITTAGTQIGSVTEDLEGMSRVTISSRLAYGSGGATVAAIVSTSLNQGDSWIDIARFEYTTTGLEKVCNLSDGHSVTSVYSVTPLVAEGVVDGVLGDRLRATVTSTGTYAGSTILAVRASVR